MLLEKWIRTIILLLLPQIQTTTGILALVLVLRMLACLCMSLQSVAVSVLGALIDYARIKKDVWLKVEIRIRPPASQPTELLWHTPWEARKEAYCRSIGLELLADPNRSYSQR